MQHANARLTPRGRLGLVQLVERGASLRQGGASLSFGTISQNRRWDA
jgi:hypothetical protein